MAPEAFILRIPDGVAQELKSANEEFLVEVIERGLQAVKIDRVLEQYARGGMIPGDRHIGFERRVVLQ